jgi:hypothetical protein
MTRLPRAGDSTATKGSDAPITVTPEQPMRIASIVPTVVGVLLTLGALSASGQEESQKRILAERVRVEGAVAHVIEALDQPGELQGSIVVANHTRSLLRVTDGREAIIATVKPGATLVLLADSCAPSGSFGLQLEHGAATLFVCKAGRLYQVMLAGREGRS